MKKKYILIAFVALMGLVSCDKFLDTMPDNRAEINTAEKIRALLTSGYPTNTYLTFNEFMSDNVDNIGDDNPGTSRFIDQCYTWSEITEITNDCPTYFWSESYLGIAHANQALFAIYELSGAKDLTEVDKIIAAGLQSEMAEALMIRAYNHFMLVNEFCLNYNSQTSDKDLGIPYMEGVEEELNPKYERSNVARVYELIEKDVELGLKYISDQYYAIPKYHFNVRAAYAFAARFYLFYEKWDKAAECATKCLGSQPAAVLRDWQALSALPYDRETRSNEFIKTTYDANLLIQTAYTQFGIYFGYPGMTKYSHDSYLSFTEVAYAANVWGNTQTGWRNVSGWYYQPAGWYNGSTFDQIAYWKIPYLFEYTDPVARIGYAHAVYPSLTMEETLLTRAEAYVMLGRYDDATADVNTYIKSIIKTGANYFAKDLTTDDIVNFYSPIEYATWDNPTIKKKLNPAFSIGAEGGTRESMLQCVLGMKRIALIAEGLRWFDVKRYGIEIWRRTMEPDSQAGQYDAAMKPMRLDDVLTVNDPRRALQLPQEVISAGMTPNPREPQPENAAVIVDIQPKTLPEDNQ